MSFEEEPTPIRSRVHRVEYYSNPAVAEENVKHHHQLAAYYLHSMMRDAFDLGDATLLPFDRTSAILTSPSLITHQPESFRQL